MTLGSDEQLWLADQRTQAIRPLDPVAETLGTGYKFIPPGSTSQHPPRQPRARAWTTGSGS